MTKGSNGKPKLLGRFLFGEKRKQQASTTRKSDTTADHGKFQHAMNIHDWALWRIQLNEQLSSGIFTDQQNEIKRMKEYLYSNTFYQKHSRHTTAVQLLFFIPRVKFQPEVFEQLQEEINQSQTHEIPEAVLYEQKQIRSHSDERSVSVTSVSALRPAIPVDKPVNRLSPKGFLGNTGGGFVQVNEQMIAADGLRSRRTDRSSFKASNYLHSTIGKAVKDGNVLEKIKAFEMQAAAAQAESAMKSNTINHRMPSAIHRTFSPNFAHPVSPNLIEQFSPVRVSRTRHIHPMQQPRCNTYESIMHSESRKGPAHVLEALHGDVILKRRSSSQKTLPDADYSLTAMNSITKTPSNGNTRHRHHRTSKSRTKHRKNTVVNDPRKQAVKSKRTTTPSNKSSLRRRWLKGRKGTPTETVDQQDKKLANKSQKTLKLKKKTSVREKVPSDNNRVYGVPKSDFKEHSINELSLSQYLPATMDDRNDQIPMEIVVQPRSNRKSHQQKSTNSDVDLLGKANEETRITANNKEDLFTKTRTSTIIRHQSILHLSHSEAKTSTNLRRHASQYSANARLPLAIQRSKEILQIPPPASSVPVEEQNLYETPHSEPIETPVPATHTLKKKRSFRTSTTARNSNTNRKQISKQILHSIMNSMNNRDSSTVNEAFFENGPHTNPEEIRTSIHREN